MAAIEPTPPDAFDEHARATADGVLRQAFVSAQLGMPSEDMATAVQSLWIILESLLVDHVLPTPDDDRGDGPERPPLPVTTHWQRLVTTAVTHTFVLSGRFVLPDEALAAVADRAEALAAGRLWHTRRPPAQGALVLGVHAALLRLDATADDGRRPDDDDARALVELVALGTLGVVLARSSPQASGGRADGPEGSRERARRRWDRDDRAVAAAFGVPEARLVAVTREGWACDECGCLFTGRVEGGVAYPDRMAPVGRRGPCDTTTACACHAAPLQRHVR